MNLILNEGKPQPLINVTLRFTFFLTSFFKTKWTFPFHILLPLLYMKVSPVSGLIEISLAKILDFCWFPTEYWGELETSGYKRKIFIIFCISRVLNRLHSISFIPKLDLTFNCFITHPLYYLNSIESCKNRYCYDSSSLFYRCWKILW